jgi:hypothetical protein
VQLVQQRALRVGQQHLQHQDMQQQDRGPGAVCTLLDPLHE